MTRTRNFASPINSSYPLFPGKPDSHYRLLHAGREPLPRPPSLKSPLIPRSSRSVPPPPNFFFCKSMDAPQLIIARNNEGCCRASVGGRISTLPPDVVERILLCLPLRDALRTSILSTQWRYKWAGLPHLILDEHFCKAVLKSRTFYNKPSSLAVSEYTNMINAILLRHDGPIHKFVLHIPEWFPRNPDISHWIYFVSGKFVQEFSLCNGDMKYRKLPLWMFSCVGFNHLTHLTLIDWILPSVSSVHKGFPYLISLKFHLHMVNITTGEAKKIEILVSKCPLLESLDLRINEEESCLTIHAPKLQNLVVGGCLSSLCLEETERIKALTLESRLDPKSDLMTEFLSRSPHVEKLVLGPNFLRCCTGKVGLPLEQPNLPRELGELKSLVLDGTLLQGQLFISFMLCLFQRVPKLQKLEISACTFVQVPSYITFEEDCHFNHLRSAKINGGLGTDSSARIVLQLIKMILLSSPVLEVMTIEAPIPAAEKLNIAMELLRYRRASTNAEIILKN